MAVLRVLLFGSPRLERYNQTLALRRTKSLALLAYLAVARQPHHREALLALLWPEFETSDARNNLRRELSLLKSAVGADVVVADRMHIGLDPEAHIWVDVIAFEEYIATVREHKHPASELCAVCVEALEAAVHLYADDFTAGFSVPESPAFDEWQFFRREELRQKFATAVEMLSAFYRASGEYGTALAHGRSWLALDPLHEPAHRELMQLYALAGQQSAALRQYEECVRVLDEEMDVSPDAETTQLFETIKARRFAPPTRETVGVPASEAVPARPAPPRVASHSLENASARHTRLPAQPTAFVGREQELALLRRYIASAEVRLISIVGPGGMGKTRLAISAAEASVASRSEPSDEPHITFPDGVFFVPLAALDSPAQIIPAIAEALDFQIASGGWEARSPRRQVLDYLSRRQLLLVLDNFEHLMEGSDVVAEIMQEAPRVKLLVTSRERLDLQQEHLLILKGLEYPERTAGGADATPEQTRGYSAVRLFEQSARRARHDFDSAGIAADQIAHICRVVEGMPLAIELAASWVDTLSLRDILVEIEQNLDFFATSQRNVPPRQRSIRAVFDTTWQRLSADERRIFARLSIFAGGFTRAAAHDVAGATVSMLSRLANKSLLSYDQSRDRYGVHELLRQYASERLSATPRLEEHTRERHCAHFSATLQRLRWDMEGAGKARAVEVIDADFENMQLAWYYAVDRRLWSHIDRAIGGWEHFCYWRGRLREGAASYSHAVDAVTSLLAPRPASGCHSGARRPT